MAAAAARLRRPLSPPESDDSFDGNDRPHKRRRIENEPPSPLPEDESDESHHDEPPRSLSVDDADGEGSSEPGSLDMLERARTTLAQVLARRERVTQGHLVPPPPPPSSILLQRRQPPPAPLPPPPARRPATPAPPAPINPVGPRVIVPTGAPGSVVPPAAANAAALARRVTFVPLAQVVADTRAAELRAVAEAVNAAAAAAPPPNGPMHPPAPLLDAGGERARCFSCSYGNRAFDGSDMGCRPYVTMINMTTECYGLMDNRELGAQLKDYYDKQLFNPLAATLAPGAPHPLPRMSVDDFVAHIERHTLNPIIIIGENTKMLRDLIIVVRNQLVDETTRDVDVKKVDALVKLIKAQKELLTISASSLLFGGRGQGEALALDPAAVGSVGNLRRIAPLLATASGTIGGATAADTTAGRANAPVFDAAATAAAPTATPILPI